MSQLTAERPVVPTPAPVRTTTVLVRDQRVQIECPGWCTAEHSQPLSAIEDLNHEGQPFPLTIATPAGVASALVARMTAWPFARAASDRLPYLAVDLADGCNGIDLQQRTAAYRLADDLVNYAAQLRAVSDMHLPSMTA